MKKAFHHIYIEISNICNLNCSFCPPCNRRPTIMSAAQFDQITTAILPLTDHICLHVKGEPLLHPELKEILAIAHLKGLAVNLTTNATLLPEKGHLLLEKSAPRQVSLSLHSFDANTMHTQAFDTYIESAIDFAKLFTQKTAGYISFRLWNLTDDITSNQRERNLSILQKIETAYALPVPIESLPGKCQGNTIAPRTYVNFDHLFEWPSLDSKDFGEYGTCYGLRHQLAILADGQVVPCCLDDQGVLSLGNIFQTPIQEILHTEKSLRIIEGFKQHHINETLCRHCQYRTRFTK